MNTSSLLAAAALLTLSQAAVAELVPAQWDAAGQFGKAMTIKPGKFVEVCEKLVDGAKIDWSFDATGPVDFNVHYHEGKDVRFPAKQDQVTQERGTLAVTLNQSYCWMWTNKATAPVKLQFKLIKTR